MELVVRGGDQAGVVGFGHAAALALAAGVDAGPVEEPAAGTGPESRSFLPRRPARSLSRTPRPPGCGRGGPRCGPSAGAGTARPRPRSRGTPRSPPLASKLHPGHIPPGGDRGLVAFGGPVRGDLRGEPDPVQQITRCRAACSGRGTAARSRWSPAPASTAGPHPSPRRPGPGPAQRRSRASCAGDSRHTAPPAPLRGQRRRAPGPPAPPPLVRRFRAHPQLMGYLHRLHVLLVHRRGRQPHPLPPRPPRSGQATTIGISHTSRRRPAAAQDHAGAPTVIRQTQTPAIQSL